MKRILITISVFEKMYKPQVGKQFDLSTLQHGFYSRSKERFWLKPFSVKCWLCSEGKRTHWPHTHVLRRNYWSMTLFRSLAFENSASFECNSEFQSNFSVSDIGHGNAEQATIRSFLHTSFRKSNQEKKITLCDRVMRERERERKNKKRF